MLINNQSKPAVVTDSQAKQKLKQACSDFEALFINRLLKEMRKTENLSKDDSLFKGNNPFQGLFDWELSKIFGSENSLGISNSLLRQFGVAETEQDNINSGSGLKIDSNEGELRNIIDDAATRHGVDASLVEAVILCESGGNPNAVSSRGAKGLMQLIDSTARGLGVTDPFNKVQNVNAGTAYLKQLLSRYNNNVEYALAAYNAGPSAVEKYDGVPPYKETQDYVKRVLLKCGYSTEETVVIKEIPAKRSE